MRRALSVFTLVVTMTMCVCGDLIAQKKTSSSHGAVKPQLTWIDGQDGISLSDHHILAYWTTPDGIGRWKIYNAREVVAWALVNDKSYYRAIRASSDYLKLPAKKLVEDLYHAAWANPGDLLRGQLPTNINESKIEELFSATGIAPSADRLVTGSERRGYIVRENDILEYPSRRILRGNVVYSDGAHFTEPRDGRLGVIGQLEINRIMANRPGCILVVGVDGNVYSAQWNEQRDGIGEWNVKVVDGLRGNGTVSEITSYDDLFIAKDKSEPRPRWIIIDDATIVQLPFDASDFVNREILEECGDFCAEFPSNYLSTRGTNNILMVYSIPRKKSVVLRGFTRIEKDHAIRQGNNEEVHLDSIFEKQFGPEP